MSSGVLTSVAEFVSFEGGFGIYNASQISTALLMAEGKVAQWLSAPLVPTQFVEEFPWPAQDHIIMLKRVRLISIDTVEGYYWLDPATALWQTAPLTCFKILQAQHGIIVVVDRVGPANICCGAWQACPTRIKVTYTCGFPSGELDIDTIDGATARAGVFECAIGFLQTSFGLNSTGNVFIPSFSIAGYNESRQGPERSGAEELVNQHIQNAKELVRRLMIRRPVTIRYQKSLYGW